MRVRVWVGVAVTTVMLGCAVLHAADDAGGRPVVVRAVRQSATEELTLSSRVLGEERRAWVRLPRGYETGDQRYPVLFVLDAEWHFNMAVADVELLSECSYIDPHLVPQMIVVGVVSPDRNRDFTPTRCPKSHGMGFPTSGGAEPFRRFLADELGPAVDRTYRTHPFRVVAGWSLGGLFVTDTLLAEPDAFDAYLAISPSLWWDDDLILKRLDSEPRGAGPAEPTKLVVTLGTAEQARKSLVATATTAFLEALDAAPWPNVTTELVPLEGLGHNFSPKMAYFMGLATLYSDWKLPAAVADQGLAAIDAYYAALTARYHFAVPVPEDAYGTLGWKLFEQDRRDEARQAFEAWASRHPRSALAAASLGSFLSEAGEPQQAVPLWRRAVELEKQSASPRLGFIADLERDIAAAEAQASR